LSRAHVNKRLKTMDVLSDIGNSQDDAYVAPRMGDRKVYRRIPDSDYQSVTMSSGERFYLRIREKSACRVSKLGTNMQPVGLCGVPFDELQKQAEMLNLTQASSVGAQRHAQPDGGEQQQSFPTQLWVEKFKPKTYMDLLSDDSTNRILLMWLKLWDKLVFDVEKPRKASKAVLDQQPGKFQPYLPDVNEELDESNRPQQRVALLHGPPGLGKTTLAHIVATHAGYNVVEMNASDDRSVDAFKRKLESSTQMRSVIAQDQRPNCLIIDEIDGAPAATINYLVSVLATGGKGKLQPGKKKGKSKGMQVLRPIICICNELYTPALRPLKQMALVVPFPPTASNRLANRLREITKKEELKTDLTALLALCKKTENDIRSCLSTLQFFKKTWPSTESRRCF